MATYKVLQDIEAEDTLVGPLTLRQCIYAGIALLAGYLCFVSAAKGAAFLIIFLFPFVLTGAFFAFPWSKQQSTEVWALAKIRFYIKPRKRIWDQSGAKQLVTITIPKKSFRSNTRHLSPDEIQSRLKALADTIDSRGWAVKNIELGYYTKSTIATAGTDRLIDASALPQSIPTIDPNAETDIFDVATSPVAQNFKKLVSKSDVAHREQLETQINQPVAQPQYGAAPPVMNYWHMKTIQPTQAAVPPVFPAFPAPPAVDAQSTYNGPALRLPAVDYRQVRMTGGQASQSDSQPDYTVQAPTIAVPSAPAQTTTQAVAQTVTQAVTDTTSPAILELANNNDLNVATLAREAQARQPSVNPQEVTIDLQR